MGLYTRNINDSGAVFSLSVLKDSVLNLETRESEPTVLPALEHHQQVCAHGYSET